MICLVEGEINNFWSIWENVKVETWKIENGVNQHLDQEWGNLRFQIVVVSLGQGAWCPGSQELFRRRVSVPYAWGTWLNDFQKSESNTTWAMRLERLLPLLRWSLVRSFQLTLGWGGRRFSVSPAPCTAGPGHASRRDTSQMGRQEESQNHGIKDVSGTFLRNVNLQSTYKIHLGFVFKSVSSCAVRRGAAEIFLRSPLCTWGPLSFLGLFFDSVGPHYSDSFEKQQNASLFAPLLLLFLCLVFNTDEGN